MPLNPVPFVIARFLSVHRDPIRLGLRVLAPVVMAGAWLAIPVSAVPAQADTVSAMAPELSICKL